MVPAAFTASRIFGHAKRRKQPLPVGFSVLVRIFSLERMRQIDSSKPGLQIAGMLSSNLLHLVQQTLPTTGGKNRNSILITLPISHNDMPFVEAHILHPQSAFYSLAPFRGRGPG